MEYPKQLIKNASLGEKIANELRLQIISRKIKRETLLSENQIASQFGTSRAPVREALKVLAGEGLVKLERQGIHVLGLTREDLDEIYDVRFLIESFACKRLSKYFDEEKSFKLGRIIDKMELAAKHQDYVEFSMHDLDFHEEIIRLCEHTRILNMWKHIRAIIFTALLVATKKRFEDDLYYVPQLIDLHQQIIHAIARGDMNEINQMLKIHYTDTFDTVYGTVFDRG